MMTFHCRLAGVSNYLKHISTTWSGNKNASGNPFMGLIKQFQRKSYQLQKKSMSIDEKFGESPKGSAQNE